MDKEQAAKALGIGVRRLEREVSAGRITPTKEAKPNGGFKWAFTPEEIERYQRKREAPKPITTTPLARERTDALVRLQAEQTAALSQIAQAIHHPTTPLLLTGGAVAPPDALAALVSAVERIADYITTPPPHHGVVAAVAIEAKPLLTLSEAQVLTGLSRDRLREAIEAKQLRAAIVGRAWRIRRADLDAYIDRLMEPAKPARKKGR